MIRSIPSWLRRCLIVLGIILASWSSVQPAEANFCRRTSAHLICILSIQRSAKNYWEYRAAVSIDGSDRPIELYNCRDRIHIAADGTQSKFQPGGAGEVVCRLFKG